MLDQKTIVRLLELAPTGTGAPQLPGGWRKTDEGKAVQMAAKASGWGSVSQYTHEQMNAVRRVYSHVVLDEIDVSKLEIDDNEVWVGEAMLRLEARKIAVKNPADRLVWQNRVDTLLSVENIANDMKLFGMRQKEGLGVRETFYGLFYKDSNLRDRWKQRYNE